VERLFLALFDFVRKISKLQPLAFRLDRDREPREYFNTLGMSYREEKEGKDGLVYILQIGLIHSLEKVLRVIFICSQKKTQPPHLF
jgi:hypothetical protein